MIFKTITFLLCNLKKLRSYNLWQITVGEPQILRIAIILLSYLCNVKIIAASGNVIFRSRYCSTTKLIKFALHRLVLHRADAILVDGIDIKSECLEQHIKGDKIKICYAGVDTQLFSPQQNQTTFLKYITNKKYSYCHGIKSILYSCRFSWENAPDVFLDTVMNIPDIQIIMVGNGPMMELLRKKAETSKVPVHFWGSVPHNELPLIFSNVDICLYPYSRYIGGISQVIPLSMSCEAVVITTAIGDNKALIQNGYNGFMTEEKDISAMRTIIDNILNNKIDIHAIRKNARNTIVTEWSIEKRNQEYKELLQSFA